jgi:serine protease Do
MQMQNFEKHVWAEIDLDALRANFRTVKQRAGSLPLCAVVKADSYGHGAVQCARVFAQEGASWLAVSCLAEALQLRRSGQTLPILILGHVQPAYAAALIRDDIIAACYSLPQAKALSEAAQAAPQAEPNGGSDGGAVPPPEGPRYQAAQGNPKQPPKKRRRKNGNIARSAVALVLAAAMGFVGGFVGARVGNTGGKVVIQQVAPSSTSSSDSGSASAVNTASGMTTAQVSEMVSPSVVVITTEQVVYSQWSWYGQSQVESGAGSGVVISSDGYILTCAHVVSGASNITVTIGDTDYPATVVGEDDTSDVAVLKIDATDLTPATVGNSDSLAVGESVLAVGNPLGELGGTVTSGIVSALNRSVTIQGTSSTNTMSLIQMDASVSPGNSGGGLFNMNGELIGLVNAKSSSSDAEGLGFAIPINDAIKVAQDLLENGYVSGRPYMGITYLAVTDAQTAAQLNVNAYGVYVVDVVQGGPADKAGLKTGDRIVSIDGTEIAQKDDLGTLIQQHAAGDTLSITVAREGQMQTVSLTLGEKNAQTQQAQKNS